MKPTYCSRCKKNIAVIFITKLENGKTVNEGLCLKCARELGLKASEIHVGRDAPFAPRDFLRAAAE